MKNAVEIAQQSSYSGHIFGPVVVQGKPVENVIFNAELVSLKFDTQL